MLMGASAACRAPEAIGVMFHLGLEGSRSRVDAP